MRVGRRLGARPAQDSVPSAPDAGRTAAGRTSGPRSARRFAIAAMAGTARVGRPDAAGSGTAEAPRPPGVLIPGSVVEQRKGPRITSSRRSWRSRPTRAFQRFLMRWILNGERWPKQLDRHADAFDRSQDLLEAPARDTFSPLDRLHSDRQALPNGVGLCGPCAPGVALDLAHEGGRNPGRNPLEGALRMRCRGPHRGRGADGAPGLRAPRFSPSSLQRRRLLAIPPAVDPGLGKGCAAGRREETRGRGLTREGERAALPTPNRGVAAP
jgi:hypothetical protein